MLLIDAHQDLAYNLLTFGRDYTRAAAETRRLEIGGLAPLHNGDALLGWPDYQRARLAVIFGTLFAAPIRRKLGEWDHQTYASTEQAHKIYSAQLDTYHRLADQSPDKFRLIQTQEDLQDVLTDWENRARDFREPAEEHEPAENNNGHPVGLVILMEGAEGVRDPAELEDWWQRGVRLIGPAWAGTRFCGGTREPGPLTAEGYALLEGMASFGFTLDISHMDEQAVLPALDSYAGRIIASHANALALLKGVESNRFLSDRVIQGLLARDGIIGIVPCNPFLKVGWKAEDGRQAVTLQHVIAHIDYICQLAGDAYHVAIGSDFDGGFGWQHVPSEIDTIADVRKLIPLLAEQGYTQDDIAAIFGNNWLSLLRHILPETT